MSLVASCKVFFFPEDGINSAVFVFDSMISRRCASLKSVSNSKMWVAAFRWSHTLSIGLKLV